MLKWIFSNIPRARSELRNGVFRSRTYLVCLWLPAPRSGVEKGTSTETAIQYSNYSRQVHRKTVNEEKERFIPLMGTFLDVEPSMTCIMYTLATEAGVSARISENFWHFEPNLSLCHRITLAFLVKKPFR